MKKLALFFLSGIIVAQVFSQNPGLAVDFSRYGTVITGPGYINRSIANNLIHEIERVQRSRTAEELTEYILNNVEGTPFMNDEFIMGEIYTVDSATIDGAMLRYNVYSDKMEVKHKGMLYELSEEMVKGVVINDKTFSYLPYKYAKRETSGYLEIIQDGTCKLYCKHGKKFKEAHPQKAMEDGPSPAEFRDLPKIYLIMKTSDTKALGIKNKKALVQILPEHKSEIHAFIKKNKIKHNDEVDLKKLLAYYNALL